MDEDHLEREVRRGMQLIDCRTRTGWVALGTDIKKFETSCPKRVRQTTGVVRRNKEYDLTVTTGLMDQEKTFFE